MHSLLSQMLLGIPGTPRSLLLLLAFMLVAGGAAAQSVPDAAQRLQALNRTATESYRRGAFAEGIVAAEQALALARKALGLRHRDTLTSMNNLASLYERQGRYSEAEQLYREALQLRREVLGPRHPSTLTSMNNLAALYERQGRYGEAEPLHREALQLRREVLGPRHPSTLSSMNNLASLYESQGRYGEAEPFYSDALQLSREVLGPRHPDTLGSMNNLASLYGSQGRYGEAELLYREALQLFREVLGPRHPSTLTSMNNLAGVYRSQGRYGEAEPLYREALQLFREMLGPRHPSTLAAMNNLAELHESQGRYGAAEPLYREALQLFREVLGPRHPDTLNSMANLASLHDGQGRYGEAEPLFREALQLGREVLGPAHPTTLRFQLNAAANLGAQGRLGEAGRLLREMQPQLLDWVGVELYSSETAGVRNQLIASQANYQHMAISLALLPRAGTAEAESAASAVLRFKGLQAEEEAYLAGIVRGSRDAEASRLAREIASLRSQLPALFHSGARPVDLSALSRQMDAQELALGRISRVYQQHLQVRSTNLRDLQQTLAPGQALLELRAYQPVDFRARTLKPWRWAGLLITPEAVVVRDLGAAAGSAALAQALLDQPDSAAGRQAATALHVQLLAPFAVELARTERLYIAPDGVLNLVSFAALRDPDGRRLAEARDVRLVQTGRDLLRPEADRPARGLLALGAIDFGPGPAGQAAGGEIQAEAVLPGIDLAAMASRTRETLRAGFQPLPGAAEEVRRIAWFYSEMRPDETVDVWQGAEASEARLRGLERPPRVLHLATHGFYRAGATRQERPMVLAGVALAGANRALLEPQREGVLYAIEAQGLNLEGTELVVLSACETAQGQIDYGEGVSGLVRALRTAGARNVLVTLKPVGDQGASAFMQRFYFHWLSQSGRSDPAAALRAAQQEAIADAAGGTGTDPTWAQFVMIGG